jgi:hypothetical protein
MSEAELQEIKKAIASSAEPNMKVIDHWPLNIERRLKIKD